MKASPRIWSFARIMLLCAGWFVLSLIAIAIWLFVEMTWTADIGSGSGGIGAVSVGINALVLAIPVGPPIALIVAWLIVRGRR